MVNGLRSGFLLVAALCRSDVYSKPGVNMVRPTEVDLSRLPKERSTGPGSKDSRQNPPRSAVLR